MQPPRPFRGASYDKDMFTYLPAPSNRNVLVESPRKRKSMASDHQIPTPFPNMGYVPQERLNPHENADDLRGKELPNFGPASSSRKSSKLSNYSDSVMCGHQNEAGASWHLNEREFYDSRSEWHGYNSFHGPSQSSNYNDLPPSFQTSAGLTYEPTSWSPSVTKDFNQRESHDSNSPIGGVKDFHFPNSRSSGLQNSTSMKVEGSDSNELLCGESQNLHHNFIKPVAYVVGSDERGCREPKYKVETSSNIQGFGDSSSIAAVDSTKLLGNNGSSSIYSLHEANNIIQQALRLLSAASSTGLFVNRGGSSEARADDSTTAPNSHSQSVSDFLNQRTHSKGSEAGHNLDKPIIACDKSSVNIGDGLKTENGGSVDAERLWDGTLQLSSTVVVSAIAFFKSGERMPDFSWCGSMEVKGKVRLEAFEKYVQDLPRARSRGLMVMSLRCKEGSSSAGVKDMAEVARKYREGKKVGFAQLNKGVDMYVCPHSDTIITILAKHGFFKGMSVVTEKSDPLLGCVVWRKNSTFGPTTTATPMITAPPSGDGNAEKLQTETGVQKNGAGNKSPEISASPRVTLHEDSIIIPQNKSLTGDVDMAKPNVSVPPVSEPSTVLSDDEDLPEYDFGAPTSRTVCSVPKLEQFRDSYDLPSITPQLRSENSTVCPNPSIQPHQENYTGDGVTSTGPSNQGLFPEKLGNLPETKIPNWAPVEGKKTVDDYHGDSTKNQKNLFDDDMPEWCPPEFEQIKPEVNERVGSFAQRNSMPLGSSFTDLATGRQLPPPPLPPPLQPHGPPLTQMKLSLPPPPPPPPLPRGPPPLPTPQGQFSDKNDPSKYYPPPGHLPPPPPLPPGPPPGPPLTPHFSDNDYPTAHSFPKAAVNNFMHSRQDALSTNARFQNQHYPSLPHPPPPVPERTFDSSLMHASAAGMPIGDDSRHEFSQSSTSNPVQKPRFHQSGMNNRPYQSGWRNSRR